jgi:hypothetical protein
MELEMELEETLVAEHYLMRSSRVELDTVLVLLLLASFLIAAAGTVEDTGCIDHFAG